MRIASYFHRRWWFDLRPVKLVPAPALAGVLLFGCFFELDELVEPGVGGVGNGGAFGRGGGGGIALGGSLNGGSGGSFVQPNDCPPGQKLCGGELCVPMTVENGCGNPTCAPCAEPAQGRVSCNQDTRACQVDSCDFGYADCDGNLANYDGADAGNGCEYTFGSIQTVTPTLQVPFANTITLEDRGGRNDWNAIPTYPLEATCQNCEDPTLPEITAQNEAPPKTDLDAYVRVAWDNNFFFVLAEAFDNTLFHGGLDLKNDGDGRCQNGPPCEDGFALFFDGRNNRDVSPASGNDDFHVFLGLAGEAHRPGAGPVSSADVRVARVPVGLHCYRMEAQVRWQYIVDLQGASAIDKLFPPANGQQYGFDISVNDWDLVDETPQRQSQLFYAAPSKFYHREATGYIPMALFGRPGVDAGP